MTESVPVSETSPEVLVGLPVAKDVHEGAYCSPLGGQGRTTGGARMVCRLGRGESRPRWTKA